MEGLLNVGTVIAHEDLFNLMVLSARQPELAALFNAASGAWNNAFFFTGMVEFLLFKQLSVAATSARRKRAYDSRCIGSENKRRFRLNDCTTEFNLSHCIINIRIRMGLAGPGSKT
jgi:hypothetical protein